MSTTDRPFLVALVGLTLSGFFQLQYPYTPPPLLLQQHDAATRAR